MFESWDLISSEPSRGHLWGLGHVTEALLEVAPFVAGAYRGKTYIINLDGGLAMNVSCFPHSVLHRCHLHSRSQSHTRSPEAHMNLESR